MRRLPPVHPGSVLSAEFLIPLSLDVSRLSQGLGVTERELQPLLQQTSPVTAALALRLARYFGTTPEFWLNLQSNYDLAKAEDEQGERIRGDVTPYPSDR